MKSFRIPPMHEIARVSASGGLLSEAPDLWDGLFGSWPMQEGGGATVYDLSGRRNDLTITGLGSTVNWGVGEYGNCLDFTGSTGLARGLLNETVGRPLTLMWIVSVDGWTWSDCGGLTDSDTLTNTDVVTLALDGTADQGIVFSKNAADNSTLTLSGGGTGYYVVLWTVTASDPSPVRLWANGAMDSEELTWGRGPAASDRVRLGDAEIWNSSGFDGRIACFQIWNRVLANSEIAEVSVDPWAMGRLRPRVFAVTAPAAATYDTIFNLSPGTADNDTWNVAP